MKRRGLTLVYLTCAIAAWSWCAPLGALSDSERIMPYDCHEGNQGVTNILSAARAGER